MDSLAAEGLAVPDEGVLSQRLGQSVSNLVVRADGEDLDEPFADVLPKVMEAHVDVLGARTKLRQTSELESAGVILKHFAVNDGLVADDLVPKLAHLIE